MPWKKWHDRWSSEKNFDALNEFEWYNIWASFFYQVHKDSFSHFSLQKIPCLELSQSCAKFLFPPEKSQGQATFWVYDKRGKSNPSYHLDICGCIRGHWMFMEFHKWRHDIMIHRVFGGSWPNGISSSRGKELDVAGSTWSSHFEIFGNGHINGWEETTTRSWQYHKLTCLKHPELHTCIWLESKPKFNWSR